ncbi:methylated-DNA--[protein]-cysteine S-methyltransferase [Microvirga brassicacearum]|uniref:Methylated-DNA--protein-cysteine methyltransferase n=1 Tax=Microvirga brassicacearum TaxID=2580413 RepID=A0A5N3P840_9HYPH|nr:methylated-DNA--[protein]-cysteine S-methyltransferase [Microvirga brassicacearum]KAB0265880.1 methylated-DNA--[protein]-cysteine S-methyltransferase [Microvirga brassicacearum]
MSDPLRLLVDRIPTPLGELAVVADTGGQLRAVDWSDHDDRLHRLFGRHYGPGRYSLEPASNPAGLTAALAAYFEGELAAIETLPVATGGTEFQRIVWSELRRIPCGTSISYSELARRIGRPAAVRAVGLANGANPVGIVVPCHRVIGANGTLTGYGGGIERKRWLLAHEGIAGQGQFDLT